MKGRLRSSLTEKKVPSPREPLKSSSGIKEVGGKPIKVLAYLRKVAKNH